MLVMAVITTMIIAAVANDDIVFNSRIITISSSSSGSHRRCRCLRYGVWASGVALCRSDHSRQTSHNTTIVAHAISVHTEP